MNIKPEKLQSLISELDQIILAINAEEKTNAQVIKKVCPSYLPSARNLIHYQALRKFDIRTIQKNFGNLGLSRLARAEGHVMASLLNARHILHCLAGQLPKSAFKPGLSIKSANKRLIHHTKQLLGRKLKGRRVRIMVTLPSEAADDFRLVCDMARSGMNCARINCAHDDPVAWAKMVAHIHKASAILERKIKIMMDLAGPKIRTGPIVPGPRVKKFTPVRSKLGRVLRPAEVLLVPELTEQSPINALPVDAGWLKQLRGGTVTFTDARGKHCKLKIVAANGDHALAHCSDTAYITTGTVLTAKNAMPADTEVGFMPAIEQSLLLCIGDLLTIHCDDIAGEPALKDANGNVIKPAHVACPVPEIYSCVKKGEMVLFDDGRVEGVIEKTGDRSFDVRITRARATGSRLRAEKGVNFPVTNLRTAGLTEKDKSDLRFVAQNADIVSMSFVNSKADVESLLAELDNLGVKNKLNVLLKVETRRAFDNLTDILLTAMQAKHIGVMIARGDLAVETGWENIAWIQREILSLSAAAHLPVVWATQVLENLAKKGLPSRSEITDVATSLRAECVMLNKGPYIQQTIRLLDVILSGMERHQEKNEAMLPIMNRMTGEILEFAD